MIRRLTRAIRRGKHFFSNDLIMVYTMGKVGSTSLEARLPGGFHTHTLYGFPPSEPYHHFKFGALGVILRRLLVYPVKRAVLKARGEVRIVTFYRDPKTRNPSMFMQDLPFWLSRYLLSAPGANRAEANDLLIKAYCSVFPHNYPQDWVERELARFTGVAASKLMLGNEDYRIVEWGKYKIFVGRMETMASYEVPLFTFCGLPVEAPAVSPAPTDTGVQTGPTSSQDTAPGATPTLAARNRGDHKWYAPLYADLRAMLTTTSDIGFCEPFRVANGYHDKDT